MWLTCSIESHPPHTHTTIHKNTYALEIRLNVVAFHSVSFSFSLHWISFEHCNVLIVSILRKRISRQRLDRHYKSSAYNSNMFSEWAMRVLCGTISVFCCYFKIIFLNRWIFHSRSGIKVKKKQEREKNTNKVYRRQW